MTFKHIEIKIMLLLKKYFTNHELIHDHNSKMKSSSRPGNLMSNVYSLKRNAFKHIFSKVDKIAYLLHSVTMENWRHLLFLRCG